MSSLHYSLYLYLDDIVIMTLKFLDQNLQINLKDAIMCFRKDLEDLYRNYIVKLRKRFLYIICFHFLDKNIMNVQICRLDCFYNLYLNHFQIKFLNIFHGAYYFVNKMKRFFHRYLQN